MGWIYVFVAAISEMFGAWGLNTYSKKRSWASGVVYFGGLGLSLVFLYQSFRYLQVSVAYAVWIGLGTAGIVLMNMLFFGESRSPGRLISLLAIIIGVVGLKALS